MINLTFKNDPTSEDTHAFVGKGVVFDAGGLNIKPTGFMEDMYMDKAGACAVFAAFSQAVEMDLKVNLTCTMAFAENFLGEEAYRPSDIIKSRKGLTVEIGNTDAEGRLILADAMTWTQEHHKVKTLIELSTLTGACVVALGNGTAGLFTNTDTLGMQLLTHGETVCEPLWRLPIMKEHRKGMEGTFSALNNAGKG